MTTGRLCSAFGLQLPLFQAGMGGIAGDALAGAVSEAGAGGVLGLFRMRPHQIIPMVLATSFRTTRPFGVNLIPELMTSADLADQVDAVLRVTGPSVFFVFYGLPDPEVTRRLLKADRRFLIQVGDIPAIASAEELGAVAVILQGNEAGGHLLGETPLSTLLAEALDRNVRLPIVVSGGIGMGHEFRRLARMGVSGCMCGTLFAATLESCAHPYYKARLVEACATDTVITDRYRIGWPNRRHRVLRTELTEQPEKNVPEEFIGSTRINNLRHPIARFSAFAPDAQTQGRVEEMAMYAGTSVNGVQDLVTARHCIERFFSQYNSEALQLP